ncbi:MAG: DNA recombination protein RmuC, partial [Candidatus Omnitrophica bacterium]|nr:DNA recombination protein RmuC [Candidatus Omnitrophota bacterium]
MPNVLIVFIVIAISVIATFAIMMLNMIRQMQKEMQDKIIKQERSVEELKAMLSTGAKLQDKLTEHAQNTMTTIGMMRTELEARLEARKDHDDANRQSLKRLEEIIAGTKSKGIAGENILSEAIRVLPPEMITRQFRINGKEVEFGLVLPNKKVVPIDSKWPSTQLLDELSAETDESAKSKLRDRIEKELMRRVQEVSQYIDTSLTIPWAIAAVPDGVYNMCHNIRFDAFKKHVILISYGMTLPYLLSLFSIHLQYSGAIDKENLSNYLIEIERNLRGMLDVLDNKLQKSKAMLESA